MESVIKEEEFKHVQLFKLDNSDFESKKQLNVRQRGTLILFKGSEELGRVVWLRSKDQIREFLSKGL